MKIYIASSWKNQHAVELLTDRLRNKGHEVLSFVEQEKEAQPEDNPLSFGEWCDSDEGGKLFKFDTDGATQADLVIYIGPSGTDAWAEVGAAWAAGRVILGLWSKGEQAGLMRRMVTAWYRNYRDLLECVDLIWSERVPTGEAVS